MNVLAIGNSFSQDAVRYLHSIAKADNNDITVINLFIGGCPLSKHYSNMLTDGRNYQLQFNGDDTGFGVSIQEALVNREWDYITFQQASHLSFDYESYQPYLLSLSEYVKKYAPKAKRFMHQTWAYEQGSERLQNIGYCEQADMFVDIKRSYQKAAIEISADGIIPSGELFQKMLAAGISKVHRDTFHASLGIGRYALALLWYRMLFGKQITNIKFCDFDVPVAKEEIEIVKKCVSETALLYE